MAYEFESHWEDLKEEKKMIRSEITQNWGCCTAYDSGNVICQAPKREEKKVREVLSKKVLEIWYEKRKKDIDDIEKKEVSRIVNSDPQIRGIRELIDTANEIIKRNKEDYERFLVKPNYTALVNDESNKQIQLAARSKMESIKQLDQVKKDIEAMLILCDGRTEKEAEVLNNYGITDGLYGQIM